MRGDSGPVLRLSDWLTGECPGGGEELRERQSPRDIYRPEGSVDETRAMRLKRRDVRERHGA